MKKELKKLIKKHEWLIIFLPVLTVLIIITELIMRIGTKKDSTWKNLCKCFKCK